MKPRAEERSIPVPVLSVMVINFNSWPDIQRLLDSLVHDRPLTDGRAELLLIDNASPLSGPPESFQPPNGVQLLRRARNDGFAAAVNDGFQRAGGRWLLLLNPDVEVDPRFLDRVLDRIETYENRVSGPPGIVGFALRNPDGSIQPSVGAFPSLAWCLREVVSPRTRRKYRVDNHRGQSRVAWVTGACMLIRSELLQAVGGMDDDFFLYHEEVALCRQAWAQGWPVEFDPTLQVVHHHPLQNRAVSPKLRVITRHSKLLYFRKYLPRWQFEGLAQIVQTESLAREFWARLRQRPEEAAAWRTVRRLPRAMRREIKLRGVAVLELAEAVTQPNRRVRKRVEPVCPADWARPPRT